MGKMITVDERRCLACKACVIECALAHTSVGDLAKAVESGAKLQPRIHVEAVGEYGTPLQCRHCTDAPCVAVCPADAIKRYREEGPVLLDEDRCIGCGLCMLACPFGVIDMSRTGKGMVKCDLCIERTAMGEQPACVSACHTHALKYEDMEKWLADRRKRAAEDLAQTGDEGDDASENE